MPEIFDRRNLLQTLGGGMLLASAATAAEVPTALTSPGQGKLIRETFGDFRMFMDGSTGQLKSLTVGSLELKPGMAPHLPHRHLEEEIMLITEGTGEISLEGKVSKAGSGALMYAAANREHGIVNTSSAPLTFYFIKWLAK